MAEAKIDPEIRIRPSMQMCHFIERFIDAEANPDAPKNIFSTDPGVTFSIGDITWDQYYKTCFSPNSLTQTIEIQKYMSANRDELQKIWPEFQYFHEMMENCAVILPEPEIPPRNPELESRIQRLKAEQAQREYKRMTVNVTGRQPYNEEPLSHQMREINSHLIMILQFIISVVTAFVFGYIAPYLFYGTEAVGPRLLLGVVIAFIVAIADLYFVVRFLLETEGLIKRPTLEEEPKATKGSQVLSNEPKPSTNEHKPFSVDAKPKLD